MMHAIGDPTRNPPTALAPGPPDTRTPEAVGRNAACPCGSGRRYKNCCGAAAPASPAAPITQPEQSHAQLRLAALRHHQSGRLEEAGTLYRKALAIDGNDPDALHMLGMVLFGLGEIGEALGLVRKAGELSEWTLPGIRSNLGLILGAQLTGKDATRAARLRIDYDAWLKQREARRRRVAPLVSVIVPSYNHARYIRAALVSVFRQTYPKIELIVIDDGSGDGSPELIRTLLQACPFPHRFLARDNRGAHATINEGVGLATGEYINVLNSDDCFATDRIARMVDEVAGVGADWGFSAVTCIDDAGAPLSEDAEGRVAWILSVRDKIRESDTVGAAVFGESNVSVSTGNLFVSRAFYHLLGGFGNYRYNHDWDFCLRALWRSEPCFVPDELYRYRLHANNTIMESTGDAKAEANEVFGNYHALAVAERPINPFAPSRHTLGLRYYSKHLVVGGGEAFPVASLTALADELAARDADAARERVELAPDGLNIVGYFRGEFGLAISARALANACMAHDLPVCLRDADVRLSSRQADRSMDAHLADEMRYRTTLIYLNPDMLGTVCSHLGKSTFANQYRIGYWYWELERLPSTWRYAFDLVDEIWVASDFVRAAVMGSTDKPVTKIPHSINVSLSRAYRRAEFGLPDGPFLFLFSFDFNSFASRKNPEAAIHAFSKAFPGRDDDVRLVVKCTHGRQHPRELAALHQLIAADPRIVVLDRLLERDALHGLQSVCDAYVSLHRSEGLGLGMAECMALGMPVIATAYSGNLEFMNPGNSCLVDFSLKAVARGEYLKVEEGWYWADADIDHAASCMRKVCADAAFRTRIGRQAKADIETQFTDAVAIAAIRRRLAEIAARSPEPVS